MKRCGRGCAHRRLLHLQELAGPEENLSGGLDFYSLLVTLGETRERNPLWGHFLGLS